MMKFMLILLTLVSISIVSCSNYKMATTSIIGNWSLIQSTDKQDEYYQLKITKHNIERLYLNGTILTDKNLIMDKKITLSNNSLTINFLSKVKLNISDANTSHIFKRIDSDCYCFCINAEYYYNMFNYKINHSNTENGAEIAKIKEEMWDYFSGDIFFDDIGLEIK